MTGWTEDLFDVELARPAASDLARHLGVPPSARGPGDEVLAAEALRRGVRLWSLPGTGCDEGAPLGARCGAPEARVSFFVHDGGRHASWPFRGPAVAVRMCALHSRSRRPGAGGGASSPWREARPTRDLVLLLRAREVLTA